MGVKGPQNDPGVNDFNTVYICQHQSNFPTPTSPLEGHHTSDDKDNPARITMTMENSAARGGTCPWCPKDEDPPEQHDSQGPGCAGQGGMEGLEESGRSEDRNDSIKVREKESE